MLRHVPTCCEAHGDGETALLRLVEALVQRLLGIGQTPWRRGARGQRIRAIAEPLGCVERLPWGGAAGGQPTRASAAPLGCVDRLQGGPARRAPRKPLLADVAQRLLDRRPV